jgi:hypothetical protein
MSGNSNIDLNNKSFLSGALADARKRSCAIDGVHVERCIRIGTFSPEVRACIDYIINRVVCAGIEVRKESMEVASPEFVKHVHDHYNTFVTDVLRLGLTVGVVPYTFVKSGNFRSPVVLHDALCDIVMTSTGVARSYTLDKGVKRSGVFFEVFSHLSNDGMCTSRVAALIRTHDQTVAQETNSFIANELNARPPLFLTTGSSSFNEVNIVDSSGINAETEFNSMLLRNKIQMNVIRAQQMQAQYGAAADDILTSPLGRHRDPYTSLPTVSYAGASSFIPDYITLPNDTRLHAHNVATAPGNLHGERVNFRELATAVFGIPSSVFSSGVGSMTNASASLGDTSIACVVQHFKRAMSKLCLTCYSVSFNDHNDDVTFVFPAAVDRGNITQLYKDGIIKRSYLLKYLSDNMEIPLDAFEVEHPNEPRTAQVHPPANQNPHPESGLVGGNDDRGALGRHGAV